MKNRFKYAIAAVIALVSLGTVGCTEQERARTWGGNATVELKSGQKLVNATWKGESDLWLLTRQRRADEAPERYVFEESSSWGVMEGRVVIIEK